MKSTVITFISAIALAAVIMAGIYTQLKRPPVQPLQAVKPQADLEQQNPVINANNVYAELVSQLQQQELQLITTLDKKFASFNQAIDHVNKQVEGIAERVKKLESGQYNDYSQIGSAHTSKLSDTGPQQRASKKPAATKQLFRQTLTDEFTTEQIDSNFDITARENVQILFANQEKPVYQTSHLKSIECRSASCRVEISHDPETDAEDFESEFLVDAAKAGFPRVRGYYTDVNGINVGTYYLAQKNSSTQANHE